MPFLNRHPWASASAVVFIVVAWATWPQVPRLSSHVVAHGDPLFSIWRLGWIAHALRVDPHHLFNANVFYPEARTLAYSDATMLEGALTAPFFWAKVSPLVIYNVALLAGMWASGLAMFALARRLTGSNVGALIAASIFVAAPYRLDHVMHLELQWAMWIPLALLALHDTVERGSWRSGALVGVLVWLQILSSIYYGIFLGIAVAIASACLLVGRSRPAVRALGPLAAGVAIAVLLTIPYARPYIENARALGPRDVEETIRLSAVPANYFASTYENWLWGWTAVRFGAMERFLFPGAIALVLAIVGCMGRPHRIVWTYIILAIASIEMSFGLNGWMYSWLYHHVPAFHGFRAPVRFAIIALCAIAVLAAFGVARIERAFTDRPSWRGAIAAVTIALIGLEYATAPGNFMPLSSATPDLYRMLGRLPDGVVVELPMPLPWGLPGNEATFEYWSLTHWKPLVNGYSGYYPVVYLRTLNAMRTFPDDESIARLKRLDVRYVVLHESLYDASEYARLLVALGQRREIIPTGQFRDWEGRARLFELAR